MIPNALSSASKLALACCLLCVVTASQAQRNKPKPVPSTFESFLDTQFWLGLRFGVNYTDPIAKTRYSVFSPINYESESLDKEYYLFTKAGGQAGLDLTFYHRGLSLGLQPTFKIFRYEYDNNFEWAGSSEEDRVETEIQIDQKLDVIEVPLIIKYDILKRGQIRPFVLAGLHYSFIVSAQKKAVVTQVDYLSDIPQEYEVGRFTLGNKDDFQNFYGALGGIGASFDYFNIRTVFEATYMYGLSEITNGQNPFTENELASLGDVNDELRINNINVAISFVFPLRYIDKTFQAY